MERSESASFSKFSQAQIQRMRDAFQFMDEDGDGTVSKDDLKKMYSSLGTTRTDEQIESMLTAGNGDLTFPEFLTVMGERLGFFPEEQEILEALRTFCSDAGEDLNINAEELRNYLMDAGFKESKILDEILSQFCTTHLSGERIFKGQKFLETVE